MKRVEPREINRLFARVPTPTAATLELTNRCNLACFHCVRDSPLGPRANELSLDEWKRVLDELADVGTFSVCFTGGEATSFPGLMDLVHYARSLRMVVTLKTNGMTLDRLAPALAAAGVGLVEVSIYGADAATHERCTGIERSFDRTVAGIRAARSAGLSVTVNANLFRWNAHQAAAIRSLIEELGCLAKREYILTTTDRGRPLADAMMTPEQIRSVESVWPGCTIPENQNGFSKVKVCTQGMNTLAITSAGEILSCVIVRRPLGDLRQDGLAATWRRIAAAATANPGRPEGRAHGLDYSRFTRCHSCPYLPKCHVCVGQNLAATGDFYEPPLERCYITLSLYGRQAGEEAA